MPQLRVGAGRLDSVITIERSSTAVDAYNESVPTWAPIAIVRADNRDISDGERMRAEEIGATMTTRFLIRYSALTSSITPRDRITCNGRIYDIHGIKTVSRNSLIEVTAASRSDLQ